MYARRLEQRIKFNLGLNAPKTANYIEKYFKKKLFRIKFPTKNSVDAHLYLPQELNKKVPKVGHFSNLGAGKQVHFRTEHKKKNTEN